MIQSNIMVPIAVEQNATSGSNAVSFEDNKQENEDIKLNEIILLFWVTLQIVHMPIYRTNIFVLFY